jgi:hypothetical protein
MIKTSITHCFPVLNTENVLSIKILTQLTWSINGLLNGLASLRTSVQSSGLRLRTKYLWQTHHQKSNSSLNLKTENHFNSHAHNKMLQNKYLSPGLFQLWRWRQQDSMNIKVYTWRRIPEDLNLQHKCQNLLPHTQLYTALLSNGLVYIWYVKIYATFNLLKPRGYFTYH